MNAGQMEMGQAPTGAPTGQGQMPMTQEEALEMRRLLLQQSEHLQMLSQRIQAQEAELVQLRSADPSRQVQTPLRWWTCDSLASPKLSRERPMSSQTGPSY